MLLIFSVFVLLINASNICAFPGSADEVTNLPGLTFKINYRHYSGYLNSTGDRHLHYWFVESQNDPVHDPVVLWLNGGPGCSSLLGFLTEQGPLHVNLNGKTLYPNNLSWNLFANVIFLEAPAGVGFSYKDDGQYATNDDEVADANYAAIQSFFLKFPQYKSNHFYVTGESYGGIYVPTLSVRILKGSANINFQGFAIGNGFLDRNKLGNALILFGYYHGLYGQTLWETLVTNCCSGVTDIINCNFVNNSNVNCINGVLEVSQIIRNPEINIYNLYEDCQKTSFPNNQRPTYGRDYFDRKLMLKSLNLDKNTNLMNKLKDTPPCIDTSFVGKWINQPDVRAALHIPAHLSDWEACSIDVEMGYTTLYSTMKPQILQLVTSQTNITGLIYNGDVDMACNFLGDQWFIDSLGLQLVKDYTLWHYKDQIAGFYKIYNRLGYATIKGSGHMVPEDKPGPALKMFYSFINKIYDP